MRKLQRFSSLLVLLLVLGWSNAAKATLSGTYTINGGAPASATNYLTVSSAISDLMSGTRADGGTPNGAGVAGPVVLRIVAGSGPYNEQITIGAIAGASAVNTIRITGGPTRETIQFTGTTTADRQVIKLNGASYIHLDSLTILNNDPTNGFGVHLTNNSDNNSITNSIITVNNTSTSSNFAGIAISGASATTLGDNGDNNLIQGNTITGGYYSISINGTSSSVYSQNNDVIGNTLVDYYYYGIRHYAQNEGDIRLNRLTPRATATTSNYGMYIYYNDNFRITRNMIVGGGIYGIYGYYCNYQAGAGTTRALIANNMITGAFGSTTPYGIYLSTNATNVDIVHNSVSMTTGNGRCLYIISGSGNTVQNNIFSYENSTTGYALYVSATTYVTAVNYNDYYVPGSSNFIFVGSAYTPLNFVGGGGYNMNSLNIVPNFVNPTSNLHIASGASLYDAGTNVSITEDYDGQVRPLAPSTGYDIGADEFTPPLDDAGVAVLASPTAPFAAGLQNVGFQIRNFGLSTLTSATVNWQVNGVPQTPYAWTGSVASATNSASFNVGTFTFATGNTYNIKAWTTNPNGNVDANAINDTLNVNVCVGMSGNYTIGGVGADFPTINAAVDALQCGGVSGPVNFDLTQGAGPFVEQVIIPSIAGASSVNTIRFNGGANRETVQFTGTTTNNRGVFILAGASHIILDSLTIFNSDPTYAYAVHITQGGDNNQIINSYLEVSTTSTSSNMAVIALAGSTSPTSLADNGDGNKIMNNEIVGGYYGISINGPSTTQYNFDNDVIGNDIKEVYYYGIRHSYQSGGHINNNKIRRRTGGSSSAYAMYIYYNDMFEVDKNDIHIDGGYGIYVYYGNYQGGTSTVRSKITNNMVGGMWGSTTPYGIYLSTNCTDIDVWQNSVSMVSGNGRALYVTGGTGNDIRNNSFSVTNSGSGYAAYVSATTYLTTMNYNNYYCPGSSNFIYIGGAFTPSTYIGGAGFNANSRDGDPFYIDPATDLHAFATQLFDAGDPGLIVTPDFDDEVRPNPFSTIPDIGADEFLPDSINITTTMLLDPMNLICPDSNQVVRAVIFNKGLNSISNIAMTAEVSGFVNTTLTAVAAGPLSFGMSDTVTLGTINTWSGGNLSFKVYNSVPNDQSLLDDTLTVSRTINQTPAAPLASNTAVCFGDSTDLIASATGTQFWYDAPVGGNLVGQGDTINTGALTSSTNYYVESRGQLTASLMTTFANNNSCGGGNMVDITAISTITIDSFDMHVSTTGPTTTDVYYKVGGYTGFETNSAAWTLLGSMTVNGAGTGTPTRVPLGGLTIPAGQTYAVYFYNTNVVYTTLSSTTVYSSPEVSISSGVGLCGLFSGTNNPRGWNGQIYYQAIGCPSPRVPVAVTVNNIPSVSLNDTTACGSATLDAGNAGMGYSYLWSNGDTTELTTVTSSGTYSVTVSNGNCEAIDSLVVTINNIPNVNLGADTTLCDGISVTLDAGMAPNGSYLWSTGATTQTISVSTAGTYWVQKTNGMGCTGTDSIVVTTAASPSGSIAIDTAACPTIAFTATNTGGASTTDAWDFGDGNTGAGMTASHSYATNGTYTVTYTQSNGCGTDAATATVTISCIVGVEEGFTSNVSLYPNPTQGLADLVVNFPNAGIANIEITDINGRLVLSKDHNVQSGENNFKLDLNSFSVGVYLVRVKAEGFNWQGKLVKE